ARATKDVARAWRVLQLRQQVWRPVRRGERHGAFVAHTLVGHVRLEIIEEGRHGESDEEILATKIKGLANGLNTQNRRKKLLPHWREGGKGPKEKRSDQACADNAFDFHATREARDPIRGEEGEHRGVSDGETVDAVS